MLLVMLPLLCRAHLGMAHSMRRGRHCKLLVMLPLPFRAHLSMKHTLQWISLPRFVDVGAEILDDKQNGASRT